MDTLSRRALAAAVAVAGGHGVRCAEPRVLGDGANLLVHLAPAPVVARVGTSTLLARPDAAAWFGREVALVGYLHGCGAAVVPPSAEVPPGPHIHDGLPVSFWEYVEVDPDRSPEPADVGLLLRDLHQALADYPGELPFLGTPLVDIARFLAAPPSGLDVGPLRSAYDELSAAVADLPELAASRPLHGDPHPGNLLADRRGGFLWGDFEDGCSGPLAWDLACLAGTTRLDGAAALVAYGAAPAPEVMALMRRLRRLHGTVWWALLAERFPEHRQLAAERLAEWTGRTEPRGR